MEPHSVAPKTKFGASETLHNPRTWQNQSTLSIHKHEKDIAHAFCDVGFPINHILFILKDTKA